MISKPNPNRPICSGDVGVEGYLPRMSARARAQADSQTVRSIKARMSRWSDKFLQKVLSENKNKLWQQAAMETLSERKL